jgi:hypothetical protein
MAKAVDVSASSALLARTGMEPAVRIHFQLQAPILRSPAATAIPGAERRYSPISKPALGWTDAIVARPATLKRPTRRIPASVASRNWPDTHDGRAARSAAPCDRGAAPAPPQADRPHRPRDMTRKSRRGPPAKFASSTRSRMLTTTRSGFVRCSSRRRESPATAVLDLADNLGL